MAPRFPPDTALVSENENSDTVSPFDRIVTVVVVVWAAPRICMLIPQSIPARQHIPSGSIRFRGLFLAYEYGLNDWGSVADGMIGSIDRKLPDPGSYHLACM